MMGSQPTYQFIFEEYLSVFFLEQKMKYMFYQTSRRKQGLSLHMTHISQFCGGFEFSCGVQSREYSLGEL